MTMHVYQIRNLVSGRTLVVLCALCVSAVNFAVHAQSRQIPAPPSARPIMLTDGVIHPVTGADIDSGYIVIENGVIVKMGAGLPPSTQNFERINLAGLHVYPGLIAANTQLGLTEIGDIEQTVDTTETGRIKPEVRAAVAINPDSDLIPVARANGILTALTFPTGGLIAGQCSAIRLDGWTWEDLAIEPDAGVVVNWPRTEPSVSPFAQRSEEEQRTEIRGDLDLVEKFFDEAAAYVKARDARDPKVLTDLRLEAMRAVLAGEKPVFVQANTAGQIESAASWAVRRKLRIVIVGGAQADRAATTLKKHDIPVIIAGLHRQPTRRHEAYDQPFTLPARLFEAGVRFCIAPAGEAAHTRNLNHMVGTAVAYGLPRDQAIKSVTLDAARIIGLEKTHGSIEPGKSATLIITTGEPFEITSDVTMAFVDGRQIDLGSRHKALNEKYRQKYRQLGLVK